MSEAKLLSPVEMDEIFEHAFRWWAGGAQGHIEDLKGHIAAQSALLQSVEKESAHRIWGWNFCRNELQRTQDAMVHYRDELTAAEHRASVAEAALAASVGLQSHYAALLNDYDGGARIIFADAQAWIDRLALLHPESLKPENGG